MSPKTSWNTIVEASENYCLETSLLLTWVDQGMVRVEHSGTRSIRVYRDDLELNVREMDGNRI